MRTGLFTFLFPLLLTLAACDPHQEVLESNDDDLKLRKAKEYYNQGDYMKASEVLEELVTLYRGSRKGEKVRFYYAYSFYGMEDYVMASYYFDRFRKTFPNSERAEEAFFMSAYCDYQNSPKWSLDQSETRKAINKLQLFLERYPESERADSCSSLLTELRGKLERKAFEKGKLYFRTMNYRAAVRSFENTLEQYPDSRYREEIYFFRFKAKYKLAERSVERKKVERFENALESYRKFADNYPESEHMSEAERLVARSKAALARSEDTETNAGS